ncbi:hypothetical protein HDZ31DRAFT_59852 [Schizophyllum fasciatum]
MSIFTPARTPLAPVQPMTLAAHSAAFDELLANIMSDQPHTKSSQREEAIHKVAQTLKAALPRMNDKLHNAVASPAATSKSANNRRTSTAPKVNEPCYKWLLAHLHNPYPTREEWETLARESQTSVREVASWFMAARKRIGWSLLRATRFGRSQIGIVEAASRFWPERDVTDPLPLDLELRFAEIDTNARSLYADILQPSNNLIQLLQSEKTKVSVETPPRRSVLDSVSSKKRRSCDGDLDEGRPTKRRSVFHDVSVASKPHNGCMPRKRTSTNPPALVPSVAATAITTVLSAPPHNPRLKFGEPSLQLASPTRNLKRSLSIDDPSPPVKRRRVLPEWHDLRTQRVAGHDRPRNCEPPVSRPITQSRSTMDRTPKHQHGRCRDARRTVSDPIAPPVLSVPSSNDLTWRWDSPPTCDAVEHTANTSPSVWNDSDVDLNLLLSVHDGGIGAGMASADYFNLQVPGPQSTVDTFDVLSDVPALLTDAATSPTSSVSLSPPSSAPITPPKLLTHLTGDSVVVNETSWTGLWEDLDPTYGPCYDSLAFSSGGFEDVEFLSTFEDGLPLSGSGYAQADIINCSSLQPCIVDDRSSTFGQPTSLREGEARVESQPRKSEVH